VNEIERLHGCISDRTTDDGVPIEVFLSTVGNPVLLNDDELLRLGPQLRAFEGTEYLDLSNIPVTDKGLAGVEGWDSLTAINLANTRVSFAGLVSLRKSLPRLKTLYLEGVKLNAADLAHIREEVEVK